MEPHALVASRGCHSGPARRAVDGRQRIVPVGNEPGLRHLDRREPQRHLVGGRLHHAYSIPHLRSEFHARVGVGLHILGACVYGCSVVAAGDLVRERAAGQSVLVGAGRRDHRPGGRQQLVQLQHPEHDLLVRPRYAHLGHRQVRPDPPADGDTYVGAPGAVLNGQNVNEYAFIGGDQDLSDENVAIEYLTIENFNPNQGGGAVNGNGDNGWTEKYDLMKDNSPGAAMMLGGDNVVADNCLTQNGEYGFNGYSFVDGTFGSTFSGGATNITFTGNDVSDNNTQKTQAGVEGGGKFWRTAMWW